MGEASERSKADQSALTGDQMDGVSTGVRDAAHRRPLPTDSNGAQAGEAGGIGIVWFRRDLRVEDNPAWSAATRAHRRVIGCFVIEPALIAAASERRVAALAAATESLDRDLRSHGGALCVLHGPAHDAIPALAESARAESVHINLDPSPFARMRDRAVAARLAAANSSARLVGHHGNTVHTPGTVTTAAGTLSKVFTPFYRRWAETPLDEWPLPGRSQVLTWASTASLDQLRAARGAMASGARVGDPLTAIGRPAALERLARWLERVDEYEQTHDLFSEGATSELSAALRFGTLSAREVLAAVGSASTGRSAFARQLAWRDWWAHMLWVQPDLALRAARRAYDDIAWRNDPAEIDSWRTGHTGVPIVDAGMRQLAATGWMPNRVRMVTASYLVKNLLVDWRVGEAWFRRHLLDADVAQNAGNWQWVAGTGPDAAPYFRVFNPVTQSRKFDPKAAYLRQWLPELQGLDDRSIHDPSSARRADLQRGGVTLGVDYPLPAIDQASARARAIAAYRFAVPPLPHA